MQKSIFVQQAWKMIISVNFMTSTTKKAGTIFSFVFTIALICLMTAAIIPVVNGAPFTGPSPVDLGSAGNFAVLAKTAISDVPPSDITGDLGTSPITGAAITGLTCAEVEGTIYSVDATGPVCRVTNPALLTEAVSDMETAYTNAAKITPPDYTNVGGGVLGGMRLAPGLYKFTTAVTIPTDLTLTGGPNDVWIFQVAGALNIAAGQHIRLTGGAQPQNIFWVVGGATNLGANSDFSGTILDKTAMTIGAGATLHGRALAQTAVTMSGNTVTIPKMVTAPTLATTSVPVTTSIPVTTTLFKVPVTTKAVTPIVTNVVIVNSPPGANFIFSPSDGVGPLGVTFTDTTKSVVPINSWMWDFGDGTTSTLQNPPVHMYSSAGVYTVKLTVTDGNRAINTKSVINAVSVSAHSPPVAKFSHTPNNGVAPLKVTFTDASTDTVPITTWLWDFGDGTISTLQNPPVHTYSTVGSYTVKLTVTDGNGMSNTKSIPNAVSASVDTPPVADFVSDPATGTSPLIVTFTDRSSSAFQITSWAWDFGFGTPSTEQNPTHTYISPGLYSVSLTVTDSHGGIATKSVTNAVSVSPPPVAAFTVIPASGPAALDVIFTDTSLFAIPLSSWVWDFGDGTQSVERSPAHTYSSAGLYTVKLTVTDGYGAKYITSVPNAVSVDVSSPPIAKFTLTPKGGTMPLKVTFADTSSSAVPITSWLWDFGDGTTSTLQNPVHTFFAEGAYPIHLTVTDENGVRGKSW